MGPAARRRGRPPKQPRPPVPAGFEVRARDNRWHLYRLNGRKLSANGKPMWDRSYLGSFTEGELRGLWAEKGQGGGMNNEGSWP